MYGTRQPLAARTPLQSQTHTPRPSTPIEPQSTPRPVSRTLRQESIDWSTSTPSATDAETATEPDTEGEYQDAPEHTQSKKPSLSKASRHGRRGPTLTQHDLLNRYFRKDVIGLRNLDLLRCVFICQVR
jgi:phosphatidylethanolamine N-methyltransferase